ncbi:hypothetical protein JOD69_003066 [Methylocaldum sp. RMAD-M]|nr:hypothetical protein [Methylocaldum sp. RMAD-M]
MPVMGHHSNTQTLTALIAMVHARPTGLVFTSECETSPRKPTAKTCALAVGVCVGSVKNP